MKFPDFNNDCGACAALCCVSLHLDLGPDFAFDKPAGQPCPKLSPTDFNCTIHERLDQEGFGGCQKFNCLGAGQRVTQQVFKGQNWRQAPSLLPDMMDSFRIMRRLHEALEILSLLSDLALTPSQNAILDRLLRLFAEPEAGWSCATLQHLETTAAFKEYKAALPEFRTALPGAPPLAGP